MQEILPNINVQNYQPTLKHSVLFNKLSQNKLHIRTGWASKTQAIHIPMILSEQYQVNEDVAQAMCELNHERCL